jgi:hypothetical protein
MTRYMVLQEPVGWMVAMLGKAGPRVVSDVLSCTTACHVVNLLNDIFDPAWTEEAVRRASSIDPMWRPPIWLPDHIRYDYDPVLRHQEQKRIYHGG